MNSSASPERMDPDDRIGAVSRILAEAILRRKLRGILRAGRERNSLELCAPSSAHAGRTSRNGEPA